MPKVGMLPIRREEIVNAAISEIGRVGTLDVTVSQIAKRAGVSSGLAHHYLGSKEDIFVAAMRHILTVFGAEVRGALSMANNPRERLEAVIRASFSERNFRPQVVSAWLNFYVQANASKQTKRLLSIYHRRLNSNLTAALRELVGSSASDVAKGIAAMIDGFYVQIALNRNYETKEKLVQVIVDYLDMSIAKNSEL